MPFIGDQPITRMELAVILLQDATARRWKSPNDPMAAGLCALAIDIAARLLPDARETTTALEQVRPWPKWLVEHVARREAERREAEAAEPKESV